MPDSAFRCFACMRPIASAQAVCPHCGHDNHVRDNGPGYLPELVLQNQYLVGKMLGHGGFGVTYLGYDLALDRVVAIKEYFPRELALRDSQSVSLAAYSDHVADFKSGCERALRESRMAAGLGHIPNIVSVYNAVMANNTVYIIMEYIDGETLTGYVKKNGGRLPLAQALRLLTPIASALASLHARGVIHRDVKPDNIMVRRGSEITVLLDFGAARNLDNRTMSLSSLIYSPGYAPPEQCSALAVMDARVDQYAFCATLYFALTGQTPMDCQLRLYSSTDMTPIHTLNDSVSPAKEAVIMRGMAVKAEDRYPGMAELMDALHKPEPKPESKSEPEPKPESKPESKPEPESEPESKSELESKPEPKPESKPEPESKPRRSKAPVIAVAAALLAGCGFLFLNSTAGGGLLSEFIPAPTTAPTAVPDYASAASFETEELDDGTLSIKKYTGSDTIVRIPPSIDGKVVTEIGGTAFRDCSSLVQVDIPDSVTKIAGSFSGAFSRCSSLAQVSIPDSVTEIGDDAFFGCSSLEQVSIPDSVTEIGDDAFFGCSSLEQVSIPDSVTEIGEYAFSGCSSLEQVSIPDSVTAIYSCTFDGCSSLTQVSIPDSVTEIGYRAFYGCSSLEQVSIPDSVTEISSDVFSGCSSLEQVSIPDSVTGIGYDAFHGCSSLEQVSIPDSVTTISSGAFEGCTSLTSIRLPGKLSSLEDNPFSRCTNLAEIIIPDNLQNFVFKDGFLIMDSTKLVGYFLPGSKEASIPDSVTEIAYGAFTGCTSLTSIRLPGQLSSLGSNSFLVGDNPFVGCTSLAEIIIPDNLKNVVFQDGFLVMDSTKLVGYFKPGSKKASIPNSITSIGFSAFEGCSSLVQVHIPNSVTEIGYSAFYGCSSLAQVSIPDSVTEIGSDAFSGCSSLAQVSIPDSVTTIWGNTFEGCSSLTQVDIPNSVTFIDDGAFCGCSSLTQVDIPDSVTGIGYRAFYGCSSLAQVSIPDSVTEIGCDAFSGCSSLAQVSIPDSVTTIYSGTFEGCSSDLTLLVKPCSNAELWAKENGIAYQTSGTAESSEAVFTTETLEDGTLSITGYTGRAAVLTIPETIGDKVVSTIGVKAFDECESLRKVIIPDSITEIGALAFMNCYRLTSVNLPAHLKSLGNNPFFGCTSLEQIEIPEELTWITCTDGLIITNGVSTVSYLNPQATTATIPNGIVRINSRAFSHCASLRQVSIPDSVTEIGIYAFSSCSSLAQVSIPDSVKVINEGVFYHCSSLTQVDIPDSVTEIGEYAFSGCSDLTQVDIPGSVTSIGNAAFYECSSLAQVDIPDSVTEICANAFRSCPSLTQVTVPGSVTSIGDYAFKDCSSLAQVSIPASVTSIGDDAFKNCPSDLTLLVKPGSYAEQWAKENSYTYRAN